MSAHKILLVDDSKSARYALRILLQKHDFEVDTADSAENALDKVHANPPDAIFMDHLMPGMNGFEALDELKKNPATAHIPVVMCTSNDDEPYQRQAKDKGALGILPKPATPEKLIAILAAIDAAMVEPAAVAEAPPPAPAAEAQAPAAPTVPAPDREEIAAIVREQLATVLESEVRPMVSALLDERMQTLKDEIFEALLARSAQQLGEWMEAEMARVREELAPSGDFEALADKLDTELNQVKGDLMKMETEHAQAVVHKIREDVLPEMIVKYSSQLEQQIKSQVEERLDGVPEQLLQQIPRNPQLIRELSENAETAAEHKAVEVAREQAREIAETVATDKASEVTDSLIHHAEKAVKSMYVMAGAAAGVGVLAAVLVYFLK